MLGTRRDREATSTASRVHVRLYEFARVDWVRELPKEVNGTG
jgi:hypothetical protein